MLFVFLSKNGLFTYKSEYSGEPWEVKDSLTFKGVKSKGGNQNNYKKVYTSTKSVKKPSIHYIINFGCSKELPHWDSHVLLSTQTMFRLRNKTISFQLQQYTGPDSLVDKASASGAGGRRFDSQCQRHWGSFWYGRLVSRQLVKRNGYQFLACLVPGKRMGFGK